MILRLTYQGRYLNLSVLLSLEKDFVGARRTYYAKQWNNFYSPMAVDTATVVTTHREDFEI